MRATSKYASVAAAKVGLPLMGELAGLVHDLGKYSPSFQDYIRQEDNRHLRGTVHHSTTGAQFLSQQQSTEGDVVVRLASQMLALCVSSHHSGLIDCLLPNGDDGYTNRMEKAVEPTSGNRDERSIRRRAESLLASTEMQDELRYRLQAIGAHAKCQRQTAFMLGLLTRFLFSSLIDADRTDTAEFERGCAARLRSRWKYQSWKLVAERLEAHLVTLKTRNDVDVIRREISSRCKEFADREKGFYQLTVPTGGGKTLASLRFAINHARKHRMDRVIYVAPYISILDQNARVARAIFDRATERPIVLEQHSNLAPEAATRQDEMLAENWDAPLVFTTAVQLLEALFGGGTRRVRSMHQLANAVIILDEAQTLPIKVVHMFNNAANFLVQQCGSTVVLCTATQPLLDRVDISKGAAELSAQPEMTPDAESMFANQPRVDILDACKVGGWTEEEIAAAALQEVEDYGSALVIVNTKAQAKRMYKLCKDKAKKATKVFHLSTSMCPAHRTAILDKVTRRLDLDNPKPVICVSTQLMEAGVDIDFASVIRYLAGLDSIAQSAGRSNRHALRETGRVLIVNPSREDLSRLPEIRKAKEVAERVLGEFRADPSAFNHDLQSKKTISRYYEYYFFERAHEMSYSISAEIDRSDTLLSLLSTNEQAVEAYKKKKREAPDLCLRQSFKSAADAFKAIDAPTKAVIVPYLKGKKLITELSASTDLANRKELLRQAQRYSINLFPQEMDQLLQKGCLYHVWSDSEIYWLDPSHYSKELGASAERVGDMDLLST